MGPSGDLHKLRLTLRAMGSHSYLIFSKNKAWQESNQGTATLETKPGRSHTATGGVMAAPGAQSCHTQVLGI